MDIIKSEELIIFLKIDPYYGIESSHSSKIIQATKQYPHPDTLSLIERYKWLPCSNDNYRLLVFIWCSIIGLKIHIGKEDISPDYKYFLNNWTKEFVIKKSDLRNFLRKNNLPLPQTYFQSEPDNTENIIKLSPSEYKEFCDTYLITLPELKRKKPQLEKITPSSRSEYQKINDELKEIASDIDLIENEQWQNIREKINNSDDYLIKRNESGTWDIIFNGNKYDSLKNLAGLRFIQIILIHQGKELNANEIASFVSESVESNSEFNPSSSEYSEADHFAGKDNSNTEDIFTGKRKKLFNELKSDLEEAWDSGDNNSEIEIKEQIKRLYDEQTKYDKRNNKKPEAGSMRKKAQDNIRGSIKNALKLLETSCPELWTHLNTSKIFKFGSNNLYSPSTKIPWKFS